MVDMACINGSSGSPIIFLNEGGNLDKKSKSFNLKIRIIFFGFFFEGPQKLKIGELVNGSVRMQKKSFFVAKTLINFGYYIKNYELDEFHECIKKIL